MKIRSHGDIDKPGMKNLVLFTFFILCVPALVKAQHPACDPSLWDHVYRPERLQVKRQCITVTGIVVKEDPEKDGDIHMRLRLEPRFRNLLNQRNIDKQGGNLVIEPICVKPVTQQSAKAACRQFQQNITIPFVGNRVVVTGDYVLDTEGNHGWMEIHPISSIRILRRPPRHRPR